MNDKIVNRRNLIAASLGAAAVPLLASCSSGSPRAGDFRSPRVTDAPSARNVRDFGAVGDGVADDTAAFAAAATVTDRPLVLYLPAGTYRVQRVPELPDFSTVLGDGGDVSTLLYEGDDTLLALTGRQRVRFARFAVFVTGPRATAVSLSGCFRCSFDSVVIRGNHLSSNHPRYLEQRGVVLDRNTGGTTFTNCDINNFGYGIVTSCIQNYVTASKLTSNYIGVLGSGNDHNAGLSLANVEFVSDKDPRTTDRHLRVDGAANDWWLTNVWFEGAETAVSVGDSVRGGPAQFGMVNCKVAARSVCLDLIYCRQPYLANIMFDAERNTQPPTPIRIDATHCPDGTAINLISGFGDDIDARGFPNGWQVIGCGRGGGDRFAGTVVARARPDGGDLLQAQTSDGEPLAAVLPSGAWLSDRSDGGVILKDERNGYWRLTVGPDGALTTVPLGRGRPGR
ncbi:glycosyl hydrolase family 28-related protein [Nocardia sp. NPDC088792]|uniref:glycosyl hydrolase family 28-related protein n=1 Tax=Nocardia sp. NPDC088792 TaxID=3364332 RepID=UPI0038051612